MKEPLRFNNCRALVKYLSEKTGIKTENIDAHKPASRNLYVSWADTTGLHKEKMQIKSYLWNLTEEELAPLVSKMKGE